MPPPARSLPLQNEAPDIRKTAAVEEDTVELKEFGKFFDEMVDGKLSEWAREEGMKIGMEKVVLNMAAQGTSAEVISQMTGCGLSEVNSILRKEK
jgi:hypothetical protein